MAIDCSRLSESDAVPYIKGHFLRRSDLRSQVFHSILSTNIYFVSLQNDYSRKYGSKAAQISNAYH